MESPDQLKPIDISKHSKLVADWDSLQRIFIRPEDEDCKATLLKYMEQILFGLHEFLNSHVGVTEEISLLNLTETYKETLISSEPEKKLADVISDIISSIAPRAVNVASPYFVGHMTAAIPFFMVHLKAIVAALNQNVIKLETSKVLSVLEKQVLAKIHRLIFDLDESFYQKHVQSTDTSLGSFTTGGTTANLTALWVARNHFFSPCDGFEGIETEGMAGALNHHGFDKAIYLVSKRCHFSLKKAGGILGVGNKHVIPVDVNAEYRMDVSKLSKMIKSFSKSAGTSGRKGKTAIMAVVGVAGATETGIVDPLYEIADVCREHSIHFHVDAAWGGPVLLSEAYAGKLAGIERADSVTIDGHKQFFMPMTCGMVFFRDPKIMDRIAYYSNYVNRQGSVDLGIKTLEGSREANSLILDSALKIMGTKGYALMIDHGIETTRAFADEIKKRQMFELVTEPELNILTYRLVPPHIGKLREKAYDRKEIERLDGLLDDINIMVQRKQREAGRSFVSRTRVNCAPCRENDHEVVVLRAVIMNPMTTIRVLSEVLDEQEKIYKSISHEEA
ncbi:Pyridoxal-dependent decarboxylase family protein [Desulfamplus magnetovallimortis]|uniref:Pyridoxal-dependent decarboxylase family protein n=1 Tax=Desulfamplus magnetovallimortis TaxID=1246637 RepID=A0A1W1H5C0_9BACT|nr:pyridoxal-dependent decarboxylase [Desulfamplus magnetovallimortis]SLM27647.1 Pyridoxal-dependent decarboxylase family protein [Desulfamplus magnetovallimortis]